MSDSVSPDFLTGKMLIAMPGMGDPRFERSVILICSHSEEGAMGLIVNKPAEDIGFPDLLEQLGIETQIGLPGPPICIGGPVEHGRGFVIHSSEYGETDGTMQVPGGFAMTATLSILEDIADGAGPDRARLALGYAGWGPGQLEGELVDNGWLVCDATNDLVFGEEDADKWTLALAQLGVDPMILSGAAGRA